MSIETWGLMPKSQIDDETIEQAIIRLIGVHEVDPTSHLGENESIDAHRKSEIIDHLASSIVADKFAMQQIMKQTLFESIASWYKAGVVTNFLGGLVVTVKGNATIDSYVYNDNIGFWDTPDLIYADNLWQSDFYYAKNYYTADVYFGIGVMEGVPSAYDYFFGFKIVNNTIYTLFGDGSSLNAVSHGSLGLARMHSVRVFISREHQEAYFYLDNVLIRTVDVSQMVDTAIGTFGVYMDKVGGTLVSQYINFRLYNVTWANEYS
jgi:hypothetical protein